MNEPLIAYVDSTGNRITDWYGKVIHGYVLETTRVPLARWSPIHGSSLTHYRVRLVTGEDCYGRSNPGMIIRLKPYARKDI